MLMFLTIVLHQPSPLLKLIFGASLTVFPAIYISPNGCRQAPMPILHLNKKQMNSQTIIRSQYGTQIFLIKYSKTGMAFLNSRSTIFWSKDVDMSEHLIPI